MRRGIASMEHQILALRQTARGIAASERVPIPVPSKDEVRVRVHAVALNPYDWKMLFGREPSVSTVLGCDFAGTVESIGENVTRVKIGDRVAGMVQGGNISRPCDGAFAEYTIAPAHILLRLPDQMSFEDGATLPVPAFTAGLCVEHVLSLPISSLAEAVELAIKKPEAVAPQLLVYGGASSTGLMIIQAAKLSGMSVLTVCSSESSQLVQDFGADFVFDYRQVDCGERLQQFTEGRVRYAIDCISDDRSAAICSAAMGTEPGIYISFTAHGPNIEHANVKSIKIVSFTVLGREFSFGASSPTFPVIPEDVAYCKTFTDKFEFLLRDGKIKPLNLETRAGGLDAISSGLAELKAGTIRGRRLVYSIP